MVPNILPLDRICPFELANRPEDNMPPSPHIGRERQLTTCSRPPCELATKSSNSQCLSVRAVENVVDGHWGLAVQQYGRGEAGEAKSGHQAEAGG